MTPPRNLIVKASMSLGRWSLPWLLVLVFTLTAHAVAEAQTGTVTCGQEGTEYSYVFIEGTAHAVLPSLLDGYPIHAYETGGSDASYSTLVACIANASSITSTVPSSPFVVAMNGGAFVVTKANAFPSSGIVWDEDAEEFIADAENPKPFLALDTSYAFVAVYPTNPAPAPTCTLASTSDGYQIASAADLAQVGNPCDASADYAFTGVIDLSRTDVPLVTSPFTGSLRGTGDGAELVNLSADVTGGDVALFTQASGATFSNFTIRNAVFTSSATSRAERIAFLVASGTDVTLQNISVTDSTMDLSKTAKVGSLAGELSAPVHVEGVSLNGVHVSSTDASFPYGGPTGGVIGRIIPSQQGDQTVSIVDVTISASSVATGAKGGGIVGAVELNANPPQLLVTIERADVQANLVGAGTPSLTVASIGGLVGYSRVVSLEITDGSFSGDIRATANSGSGFWNSGGIIGETFAGNTVLRRVRASTTIDVAATGRPNDQKAIGGLIGYFGSGITESLTVDQSFATGAIIKESEGSEANGGLIGEVWGAVTILNSGARVDVTRGGGLIGATNRTITMTNAYAAGASTGGLIAVGNNQSITAEDTFWDTTIGASGTASNIGKGRATSAMQDVTTFTTAGWSIAFCNNDGCTGDDAEPIWAIRSDEYPFLCSLAEAGACSAEGAGGGGEGPAIEDVTPVPGDARAWIVFEAPTTATTVEMELQRTDATDQPVTTQHPASEPIALTNLDNDVEHQVRMRIVNDDETQGPWSEPVTFTPTSTAEQVASEPAFETTRPSVPLTPDPGSDGSTGTITLTLHVRNTSSTTMENLWLQALDVPDHAEIVTLTASVGTIERILVDGRDNWFWRNANLEPTLPTTPTGDLPTILVTLRVEVQ